MSECINCIQCYKDICPGDKCILLGHSNNGEMENVRVFCSLICYGKWFINNLFSKKQSMN